MVGILSSPYVDWILGGDINMVEQDGDRKGRFGYIVSGLDKQTWTRCKATLEPFDPNWGRKGWEYGGQFTWSNFRQGSVSVQSRLDDIYGPKDGISFSLD